MEDSKFLLLYDVHTNDKVTYTGHPVYIHGFIDKYGCSHCNRNELIVHFYLLCFLALMVCNKTEFTTTGSTILTFNNS